MRGHVWTGTEFRSEEVQARLVLAQGCTGP